MAKGELTPKQERFVQEYLIDLNGTQAAIRAGYSEKTAKVIAAQNLAKLNVREAIDLAMAARAEKSGITAERVLNELALLGFSNMLDYVTPRDDGFVELDLSKLTRDQAAAIQEVTIDSYDEADPNRPGEKRTVKKVKFKLSDKRAALVEIGRHFGMFVDRTENLNVNLDVTGEPLTESEWAERHTAH